MSALHSIQKELCALSDGELIADVRDFLCDGDRASRLDPNALANKESVFALEIEGDLELAVYIDVDSLNHVRRRMQDGDDPLQYISDFSLCVEGVSHFQHLCAAENQSQSISLLELELLADVEKYFLATGLPYRQKIFGFGAGEVLERDLLVRSQRARTLLFENTHFTKQANEERYRNAHRFAAQFCKQIEESGLAHHRLHVALRRFYRFPLEEKIRICNGKGLQQLIA